VPAQKLLGQNIECKFLAPVAIEKIAYLELQTIRFVDLGLQTSTSQKWVSKCCTFDFLAITRISNKSQNIKQQSQAESTNTHVKVEARTSQSRSQRQKTWVPAQKSLGQNIVKV
jgi:hypothetical protein